MTFTAEMLVSALNCPLDLLPLPWRPLTTMVISRNGRAYPFVGYFDDLRNRASRTRSATAARNASGSRRFGFSHRECHLKNTDELQEMCFQKGHNWNDLATERRRGRCIVRETYEHDGATRSRWVVDKEIPKFVNDGREYIERLLEATES